MDLEKKREEKSVFVCLCVSRQAYTDSSDLGSCFSNSRLLRCVGGRDGASKTARTSSQTTVLLNPMR